MPNVFRAHKPWWLVAALCATSVVLHAQSGTDQPTLDELKAAGAQRSSYRALEAQATIAAKPTADLQTFQRDIQPILAKSCCQCHGPDKQKGDLRIDTLDADLFAGNDVDWWLDVLAVLTNGEMPPADEDVELADGDRSRVIEWLAEEIQTASVTRRASTQHSSFRRMTRYEYNYALQDLLGLPFDFAEDLPPDPTSKDGFENSSDVLHLAATQFRAYLDSSRKALQLATVVGEQPSPWFWGVSMAQAAAGEWQKQDKQLEDLRNKHKDDPAKLQEELDRQTKRFLIRPNETHFKNLATGHIARQSWGYDGAKFAWQPTAEQPELPANIEQIAVVPRGKDLIFELGDQLPERGTLRVRVRAARAANADRPAPAMQLLFGWQASNDSSATFAIGAAEHVVTAEPGVPTFYQWHVPLSQVYPRNLMRTVSKMGDLPSPSEYLKIRNVSESGDDLQIDYIEVTAPVYEEWPPASHQRIFVASRNAKDESLYAREVLTSFVRRAWRREATTEELDQKLRLFERLRPGCESFQEAMVEVLATVLASPHFLYLIACAPTQSEDGNVDAGITDLELATRLAMFLWCSTPDEQLLQSAQRGRLRSPGELSKQIQRLLADPKSQRFSEHFVRQWLGLELLDFLHVDRKHYPRFDTELRDAMRQEPVAFFHELLQNDLSALEFLHCNFTMANERLARHYGIPNVVGNHFRRIELSAEIRSAQGRGGLLTQAGLLAMNSDGIDSHPLKRGIWMLERLLNDPPPPPPAAVPVIDLADPEIAKLTLKQRIENHRDAPACLSCHAKIDPWGIAFENFDAVGSFRTEINGQPVDALSLLFNKQKLDGVDGLKRFLLMNRQDQFVRALVYKLTTFALGRPLTFGDRAAIDAITAEARNRGDGLATIIAAIATSALFQTK